MKHYNLRITGKVQGVFFRAYSKAKADYMGITGFVRNEDNNSVYIECEGEEAAVDEFIEWCKKGPDAAKVDKLIQEEGKIKGFTSFEIEKD